MLRKTRILLGCLFLLSITLLFLDFTGTVHPWLGWMAKIQLLPAVLSLNVAVLVGLVLLSLVLGRVYCSVICPMGVYQDFVIWIRRRFEGRKPLFRWRKGMPAVRIALLVLYVAAIAFSITWAVAVLAPYSSYGRMVHTLASPLWVAANNALAAAAESAGSYAFYNVELVTASWPILVVTIVTFIVVTAMALLRGRDYCNLICPVGTVLGYLSSISWLKPVIDTDKCNGCGSCARKCKASCIDSKEHRIDYTRCVACMDCLDSCRQGAISYAHPRKAAAEGTDKDRRAFLSVSALTLGTLALKADEKTVDGGLAVIEDKVNPERKVPVTPAGSLGIDNLTTKCTACQLCITVCPNGVLRPSLNAERLMQPEVGFDVGYCRPECVKCSEVCPTGAIRPVTREEKTAIQTGHAIWMPDNCVVLTDSVSCLNCMDHCPTGAITAIDYEGTDKQVPAVNEELCIGCGACESLCPSRPLSAIYVEGHLRHREI